MVGRRRTEGNGMGTCSRFNLDLYEQCIAFWTWFETWPARRDIDQGYTRYVAFLLTIFPHFGCFQTLKLEAVISKRLCRRFSTLVKPQIVYYLI